MATEIRVPALGESITEATVGKWFKQAGDAVTADEPLVELETDKVTVEVPAPASGVLSAIMVKAGDTVAVGAVLGAIGEGDGTAKPPCSGQSRDGRAAARAAVRGCPRSSRQSRPRFSPRRLSASRSRREEVSDSGNGNGKDIGGMPPSPAARKYLAEAGFPPASVVGLRAARPGAEAGRASRRRLPALAPIRSRWRARQRRCSLGRRRRRRLHRRVRRSRRRTRPAKSGCA